MDHLSPLRRALWFLVGLLLAAVIFAPSAHAYPASGGGTAGPATQSLYGPTAFPGGSVVNGNLYNSAAATCGDPYIQDCGAYTTTSYYGLEGGWCKYYITANPGVPQGCGSYKYVSTGCPTGTTNVGGTCTYPLTCPNGGTLSGSTCTCPAGQVDTGTGCVVQATCPGMQVPNGTGGCTCPTAAELPTAFSTGGSIDVSWSKTAPFPDTTCYSNCTMTVGSKSSIKVAMESPTDPTKYVYEVWLPEETVTSGDAGKCTPTSNTATTPEPEDKRCPSGQVYGTVNGVGMCVPGNTKTEGKESETTTKTNPDGTKVETTTNKTEVTTCVEAGSCTTTITTTVTTVTKDAGGTVTGTTTETTNETKPGDGTEMGEFCEKNPKSPMCQNSSFGGTCGAFACEGDAIQCAIAKEQHTRNCQTLENHSGGATSAEALTWYNANSKGEGLDNPAQFKQTGTLPTIDQTTRSLGSGSLSDLVVDVWGESITIPFSSLNTVLGYMGSILVAVALIIAARIFHNGATA